MQFVYPNFLWALLFIAVPILIHLFYFRRYRKILFSNISFLTEVKNERASKNRLKHLLVLLSRILTIICIVLAFAQPYFAEHKKQAEVQKNISIYIDNSFSMQASGNGQVLLDEAKETAKEIIITHAKNDINNTNKYQILSNDFEGKHQRLVNKEEALNMLEDIKISSSWKNYKSIFNRQKAIFKPQVKSKIAYLISDFQSNNQLFKNDTSISTHLVRLETSEIKNTYIDSLWFFNSFQLKGAENKLLVKINNESNEAINGNYQFVLNNEVKSVGSYTIAPKSYSIDTIYFKTSASGWNTAHVKISDYPIQFDDAYFMSFFVTEKVDVLHITDNNSVPVFDAVYQAIENIDYQQSNYTSVDYNTLNDHHFIILDRVKTIPSGLSQSIKNYVTNGGHLLLVPHKDASISSYNSLLSAIQIGRIEGINENKREVTSLNMQHNVLNDIFEKKPLNIALPIVSKQYVLKPNSTMQQILSFSNQDAYLSSFDGNGGRLYFLSSSLETSFSDFKANTLFAPIVYKMTILSLNNLNLAYTINTKTSISVSRNKNFQFLKPEDVIRIKNSDNNSKHNELIPQKNYFNAALNLHVYNVNLQAGFYDIFSSKNESENILIAKAALNYNRKESQLKYYTQQSIEETYTEQNVSLYTGNINKIKEKIINNEDGKQVWKWLILFSLLFLAFEIILLRILK